MSKSKGYSNGRVIREAKDSLRFDLSQEERVERGIEAEQLNYEISVGAAEWSAKKKELTARVTELRTALARGYEFHDVPIQDVAYDDEAVVHTIRLDTGEVFRQRPLSKEERQTQLEFS